MATGRSPSVTESLESPIVINPYINPDTPIERPHATPKLRYPWPLPLLGILDVAYTIYHLRTSSYEPSKHLLVLAGFRALVLGVIVGASQRWRYRGGWIGGISVISLGSVVWEGCKGQLLSRREGGGPQVDIYLLVITGVISILEYSIFLLLLRLSPPSYRFQPFGVRIPPSAIQSPTKFSYSESRASSFTHTRRSRPGHVRYESIASRLRPYSDEDSEDGQPETEVQFTPDPEAEESGEMGFDDSESISSISESSIIDLPEPLEPNRLLPPSVSLNSGLSLAALDSSPVLGPLVRRTRSARFTTITNLGRGSNGDGREEREASSGYGTFGMA